MKSLVVPAVVLASMCAVGAQGTDPVALAVKVQQRYNGIKDISGDFVQTYEGGVLRTKTTERGTIAIKRPGRIRFRLREAGKEGVRLGRQSPLRTHGRRQAGDREPGARAGSG